MYLETESQSWPIKGGFRIARGEKRVAEPVVARIVGEVTGCGESVPYPRYGETLESVLTQIRGLAAHGEMPDRGGLQAALPAGAARAAVDCALWDYEAKAGLRSVADGLQALLGARPKATTLRTCFTLSLAEPEAMAQAALVDADRPVLKLKLGRADGDLERVRAVRAARPDAVLVADANEGWNIAALRSLAGPLAALGVALIEQPVPAGEDAALGAERWPVLLCADESIHTRKELDALPRAYGAINIKIDKAGGLTEAALLAAEARARGLQIMVGCMVATSLAMAPAALLASACDAEFVDLDGPLLLERDREHGISYSGASMGMPSPALWG
jgi:L-alanine-DL-glutamate epimerase-like enolase superfamily enzyme